MATKTTQRKYAMLYSWVKWIPMLVLIFAILGADAWLNIEKYNNDYLLWELGKSIKVLDDARQELRVRNVDIIDQQWVEEKVAEMEMISLMPGQSQVITYTEQAAPERLTSLPHAMARWDAESMAIANHESIPPLTVAQEEIPPEENDSTPSVIEQIKSVVEHITAEAPEPEEAEAEPVVIEEEVETVVEIAAAPAPVVPVKVPEAAPVEAPREETATPTPVMAALDPAVPAEPLESMEPIEAAEPLEPVVETLKILEPAQEEPASIDDSLDSLISQL